VDGDELGIVREGRLDLDLADDLGEPSMTCSRPMTVAPSRISSLTLRPSRAPLSTKSVISTTAFG
jgi:hypothetical protein